MTEPELQIKTVLSEQEAARLTLGPGGPGSLWAEIIQRLIDEGADIEFYYHRQKQLMDFALRRTDRLVYEWDTDKGFLSFTWQRLPDDVQLTNELQGLYNGDKFCAIDFITDGCLERIRQKLMVMRVGSGPRKPRLTVFDDFGGGKTDLRKII